MEWRGFWIFQSAIRNPQSAINRFSLGPKVTTSTFAKLLGKEDGSPVKRIYGAQPSSLRFPISARFSKIKTPRRHPGAVRGSMPAHKEHTTRNSKGCQRKSFYPSLNPSGRSIVYCRESLGVNGNYKLISLSFLTQRDS